MCAYFTPEWPGCAVSAGRVPSVRGLSVPPLLLQSHIVPGLSLPKPAKGRIIHFIRRGVEQSGSSSGS